MKKLTLKIVFSMLLLLLFIGCTKDYANKENINDKKVKNISILKDECYEHNLNSCYKLGNYYIKHNKIDESLNYYNLGCEQLYDDGFMTRNIKFIKNEKSCLAEAKILKNKKNLSVPDSLTVHFKLKKAAEYYYTQNNFTKAKEYYLASLNWHNDEEAYYRLSQILLKKEKNKINYKLSEKYYLLYLQDAIKLKRIDYIKIKKLAQIRLNSSSLTVKVKMTVLANGTVGNIKLITPLNDDVIKEFILKQIKNNTYYPYRLKSIPIFVNYLIK